MACIVTLLGALPSALVAQLSTRNAPLRFGVEYTSALPTGDFATVSQSSSGFLAWLALPLSQTSPLGLGAEFSVLTVPSSRVTVPTTMTDSLNISLRTTLSFVGVGSRLEARIHHLSLGMSLMPGFVRVITDLTGTVGADSVLQSATISRSTYAAALKLGVVLTFPIYVGRQSTGVGLAGGVDYTMASHAPFPVQKSFRIDAASGVPQIGFADVALSHWRWHVGVGVEF